MRWFISITLLALLGIAVFFAVRVAAETTAKQPETLLIGPGDLLEVDVLREADLTQKVRVRDSGEVTLPLIGDVKIGGIAPSKAAEEIAKAYMAEEFLKHPQVAVTILEFGTQSVSILGQVARPGAVTITTPRSLLDVLAMAGGLTETADRHITIERGGAWGEKIKVFLPNGADADLRAEVSVHPGDRILVPKAGIIYVLGDVGRPGGYVMQDDSRLTVLQVLALAAGTNRTAADKEARLLHKEKNGYKEQAIRLRAMEQGKAPDVQLEADDILYVPFSFRKNFMLGGSNILASTSSALIYAGH